MVRNGTFLRSSGREEGLTAHGTISPTYCILKRHWNGGAPIKIACGAETFMHDVTFIKTTTKKKRRGSKNQRKEWRRDEEKSKE